MIKYDKVTCFLDTSCNVILNKYSTGVSTNIVNNITNSDIKIPDQLSENDISNINCQVTSLPSSCPDDTLIPPNVPIKKIRYKDEDLSVMMFPGHGVIKVGQVREYLKLSRVKDMFKTANKVLGYDILDICLQGPQEKLDKIEYNQPATLLQSLAAVEKLWEEKSRSLNSCKKVLGYSVGEITALVFAGSISIEDGIRLAGVRGKAMQAASGNSRQGMASVLLKSQAKPAYICDEATKWAMDMGVSEPVCSIAVHQSPKVKIIAGNEEALRYIEKNIIDFNIRKFEYLPINGAFHTALMEPALKSFKKALDKVEIEDPRVDVYSNLKARPYDTKDEIKKYLLYQIIAPVKWEQILHLIYNNKKNFNYIPRTFDMGSGGSMKSIIEKFNLKAGSSCIAI